MTASPEEIHETLTLLDKNKTAIEMDINSLVYYMNGGLDYNDAWLLTIEQRKNMMNVIKRHFEAMDPNKGNKL
jgi:hypothetical protein